MSVLGRIANLLPAFIAQKGSLTPFSQPTTADMKVPSILQAPRSNSSRAWAAASPLAAV